MTVGHMTVVMEVVDVAPGVVRISVRFWSASHFRVRTTKSFQGSQGLVQAHFCVERMLVVR